MSGGGDTPLQVINRPDHWLNQRKRGEDGFVFVLNVIIPSARPTTPPPLAPPLSLPRLGGCL